MNQSGYIHIDYIRNHDDVRVRVNGRLLDHREYEVSANGVLTLMLCECSRHTCSGQRLDNSRYCNHCFLRGHDLLNQFVGPMEAR